MLLFKLLTKTKCLINIVVSILGSDTLKKFIMALGILLLSTTGAFAQTVVETTTDSKSDVTTSGKTIVISPPPSAISPSVGSSTSDLCMSGVSGAVQTQILGVSTGEMVRDENCERLKISKTLYDMGMKVAAVSVLCQDEEYMMPWRWQEHLVHSLVKLGNKQQMSGRTILAVFHHQK